MKPLHTARRAGLAALTAGALVLAALVGTPATAADLATVRDRAASVASGVTELETKIASLEAEDRRVQSRIDAANVELSQIRRELDAAEVDFEKAESRYIDLAISTYKMDDPTQVALILSSASLDDMSRAAQAASFRASAMSESIVEVARARATAERIERTIATRRERLVAEQARADELLDEVRATLAQRKERLASLRHQIKRLEAEALQASRQQLMQGLGGSGPSLGIPDGFVGTGIVIEGIASWYGPGFEGNTTASGDVFDSSLYTVASKELPFGTWLFVQHEGRGVAVVVNDRGPYVGDRILDLSRAAAQAIGISGIGWVSAEVILKAR